MKGRTRLQAYLTRILSPRYSVILFLYMLCFGGVTVSLCLWQTLRHKEEFRLVNFIQKEGAIVASRVNTILSGVRSLSKKNSRVTKLLPNLVELFKAEEVRGIELQSWINEKQIYGRVFLKERQDNLTFTTTLAFGGDKLALRLTPSSELVKDRISSIPDAAFATGISFTLLLVLSGSFYEKARRRDEELKNQIAARATTETFLHRTELRLHLLLETAPDAIIVTNEQGEILFFNSSALQMFEFSSEQELGKNIRELFAGSSDLGVFDSQLNHSSEVQFITFPIHEITGVRRGGETFPVDVSLSVGQDNHETLRTYIIRDATERKVTESGLHKIILALKNSQSAALKVMDELENEREELRKANELLSREVSERLIAEEKVRLVNEELERRNKELREAELKALSSSQAKSTFLANMTHEIRTPLTAIIGFTESAVKLQLHGEELTRVLNAALRNGQHLLQLLDDILSLSKIEAGKLTVERIPCNLKDIFADVEVAMKLKSLEKGIQYIQEYRYPLPRKVITDPTRLKQILYNLLSNAIKFTHQGKVSLGVEVLLEKEKLKVEVNDTGIGMSSETLSRVFEAFEQGDPSTTRQYGGTGLGLVITKQLVEMLGGQIEVQSQEGVGSRFSFTIDIAPLTKDELVENWNSEETFLQVSELPEVSTIQGRVLVVDDTPDNRQLLSLLLRSKGIEVLLAENGKKALEIALSTECDLILMDMHMPQMDGYQAVAELRKQGFSKPILAVTASAIDESLERCIEIGCNAYLRKPFQFDEFEQMILKYFDGGKEQEREPLPPSSNPTVFSFLRRYPRLRPVVEGWLARLPERRSALEEYYCKQDLHALRELAHLLRGAGNFGFEQVGVIAGQLEDAIVVGNYKKLQESFNKLLDLSKDIESKSEFLLDSAEAGLNE